MTAAFAAIVLVSTLLRGEPLIHTVRGACTVEGVDRSELERVLSIELGARTSTAPLRIELEPRICPSAGLQLDLVSSSSTERVTISLGDVPPDARTRAVAIIVRERLAYAATAAPADDLAPTPKPTAIERPPIRAASKDRALEIFALASVRYLLRYGRPLFGGAGGADLIAWKSLKIELGAGVYYGTATHAFGDAQMFLISTSGALVFDARAGPLTFSAGPKAELGLALGAGRASSSSLIARDGAGPVLLVGAAGSVALDAGAIDFILRADFATAARGFEGLADGAPLIGVAGWIGGISAGIRL